MPTNDDLSFMSVSELAPLIESREISAVDLVQAQLGRISELDDVLRAYIHVGSEMALGQAKAAEAEIAAGGYRGPLHGITLAHKDIIDVAGMPTSGASKTRPPKMATEDATVQAKLRAAGTICLGKLNLIEYASGTMGVYGFARNPHNLSAYPGGSSSGSGTSLAAGLVTIATGTDTGGSIRNPACFCGLAGMRATYGRVSRYGCIPLSWSQDSIGPMGRTTKDIAIMLGAMAGPDPKDLSSAQRTVPDFTIGIDEGVKGLRIGVPTTFFMDDLDPEIDAAMKAALKVLEGLGAELVPVDLKASEFASSASWTIAYSESFVYHKDWFEKVSAEYTPAFYHKIAAAGMTSAEERIVSQQIRQVVTREWQDAFKSVDVVVTPANRTLASADARSLPKGQRTLPWSGDMCSTTRPVSLTGFPAMSAPIGFAADNTAMGMQLVGAPWAEATVLRVANAYEQAAGWYKQRMPDFPAEIPPRFGANASTAYPTEVVSTTVDAAWVMDMARLQGFGFITESDAAAIAPMLAPVKDQLAVARKALDLSIEIPTRAAGLVW